MADFKISQLDPITSPNDDDVLLINDTSGAETTKNIKFSDLRTAVNLTAPNAPGAGFGLYNDIANGAISVGEGAGIEVGVNDIKVKVNPLEMQIENNQVGIKLSDNTILTKVSDGSPDGLVGSGLRVNFNSRIIVADNDGNNKPNLTGKINEEVVDIKRGTLWVDINGAGTPKLYVCTSGAGLSSIWVALTT